MARDIPEGTAMGPSGDLVVLFCSHGFGQGYHFSAEAMKSVANVQVRRCELQDLATNIQHADVLVPLMSKLDRQMLLLARKAKLILQYGVGLEGVDIPAATELGIVVSNMPAGPTGNALAVAELAIYLSFACLRDQKGMAKCLQNQVLGLPCARTLFGSHCLIVGYGAITQELIPRLKPFGVKLSCVRRSSWGDSSVENLVDQRGRWHELAEYTANADVIFLCCILNEETRNLVGRKFLQHCKDGVTIINIARGGLLEYDSVMEGLENGKIGALGADVMWHEPFDPCHPILQHPRVIVTPHIGGVTQLSYRAMAERLREEVEHLQIGQLPTVNINKLDRFRDCSSAEIHTQCL